MRKNTRILNYIGLSSFQILAMFRRGMFYTFLSIYLREFLHLTVTETTLYATLPMIVSVIFQNFVWGPTSDKLQKRRTLIISGEILAGIGTITVWFLHTIPSNLLVAGYIIILGLSCIEIFWSTSNIGWSALISDLYPAADRSKIVGHLTSIGGIGRIIGVFIGGLLYDNGYGFQNGFLFFIAASVMFISTIPMLFMPEGGIQVKKDIKINNENGDDTNNSIKYVFFVFIIALVFINFGRNSLAVTYSQYLSLDGGFNVDSVLLSFIVNSRSVAVIILGLTVGFMSKGIGDSNTLLIGVLAAIGALVITALTSLLLMIFIGSFFIGVADVLVSAASYAIASTLIPPKKRGKLFAVYNTTFFLSWGLASTLISGPLIDFLINSGINELVAYRISFLVGALICTIGLSILLGLKLWISRKKKNIKF